MYNCHNSLAHSGDENLVPRLHLQSMFIDARRAAADACTMRQRTKSTIKRSTNSKQNTALPFLFLLFYLFYLLHAHISTTSMHLALNVVQLSLIKTTYMSNCLFCHVTAQKLWHFGNVIDQLSAVASLKLRGGTCSEQWGTRTVYPHTHMLTAVGTRTVYPHSHTCSQQWGTRTAYPRSHTCSQQWAPGRCILTVTHAHSSEH